MVHCSLALIPERIQACIAEASQAFSDNRIADAKVVTDVLVFVSELTSERMAECAGEAAVLRQHSLAHYGDADSLMLVCVCMCGGRCSIKPSTQVRKEGLGAYSLTTVVGAGISDCAFFACPAGEAALVRVAKTNMTRQAMLQPKQ